MNNYLQLRIDDNLKNKLMEQAKKEHTTMSALVIRLLVKYLGK